MVGRARPDLAASTGTAAADDGPPPLVPDDALHAELAALTGREVVGLELVDPRFYHLDVALAVLDEDTGRAATRRLSRPTCWASWRPSAGWTPPGGCRSTGPTGWTMPTCRRTRS